MHFSFLCLFNDYAELQTRYKQTYQELEVWYLTHVPDQKVTLNLILQCNISNYQINEMPI